MIIGKEFHFDAAHYLPNYEGKCREMHGHTWKVTVEVEGKVSDLNNGPRLPKEGMVMDLHDLNAIVHFVIDKLDHNTLNKMVAIPTCEALAKYIACEVQSGLPSLIKVQSVKVQEGEGGYALWIR